MTDHQFYVRAVIDGSNKAVHERVEYDAYGRPKVWLGADVSPVGAPDGARNTFDVYTFLGWYITQDPRPELNGDGEVNFYNLTIYVGLDNSHFGVGHRWGMLTLRRGPGPRSGARWCTCR